LKVLRYKITKPFAGLCKKIFKFAAVCKQCFFAALCKMVLYNALEIISIFSFAQQMMLREFGDLKGLTP